MTLSCEVKIRLTGKKKQYPFNGTCLGTGYRFFAEKNYLATVSGNNCYVIDEDGNRVCLRGNPWSKKVAKYDYMISHPADWNGAAYFNLVEMPN